MHWKKVTLVGVGLLGGSLGLAIRQRRLAGQVVGYVRREASIAECLQKQVADAVTQDLSAAVESADLVVLCTPLAQMRGLAEKMLPVLTGGTIVTDVGSVKMGVTVELEKTLSAKGVHFVGSHPMAGAEKTGVCAARANLFEKAVCVITPTATSNLEALYRVERLWQQVGSRPLRLSPELHDLLVSRSSHLPHVIAAQLASFVLCPDHPREQSALCANGFRDTTRVASGSPEMWRDIAVENRENLARSLDGFIEHLQQFRAALEKDDLVGIEAFFARAKERRDQWCSQTASPSPE